MRNRPAPITGKHRVILSALSAEAAGQVYIPISPEGQEIRNHVRRSRQMRIPVGYNQSFLETYYPNETAYLPAELRSQLHILGTPPDGARPAGNAMTATRSNTSWQQLDD